MLEPSMRHRGTVHKRAPMFLPLDATGPKIISICDITNGEASLSLVMCTDFEMACNDFSAWHLVVAIGAL